MITQEKVDFRNGKDIFIYTLKNSSEAQVKITNFGGIITSILVPDNKGCLGEVTLGFDDISGYYGEHPYFGATIGRFANRLAKGVFTLNGKEYKLNCNENGKTHLHGGNIGFGKVIWEGQIRGETLKLKYVSADGEENYPGELTVTVCFTWSEQNELNIEYFATGTEDTIVNLTNHAYFNLNNKDKTILEHELEINANNYLPINNDLIPTGEILPVNGTPFDFTSVHTIGERIGENFEQLKICKGYDHCFAVDGQGYRFFARVFEKDSGRILEIYSDMPGVQLYSGNYVDVPFGRRAYKQSDAFCLETQNYPDAVNHDNFPSCILKRGENYRTSTKYCFSVR